MAYLWDALSQNGLVKGQGWPDLERYVTTHGPNNIFFGDRPTGIGETFSRYCRALGVPAHIFTKNRHPQLASFLITKTHQRRALASPSNLLRIINAEEQSAN